MRNTKRNTMKISLIRFCCYQGFTFTAKLGREATWTICIKFGNNLPPSDGNDKNQFLLWIVLVLSLVSESQMLPIDASQRIENGLWFMGKKCFHQIMPWSSWVVRIRVVWGERAWSKSTFREVLSSSVESLAKSSLEEILTRKWKVWLSRWTGDTQLYFATS